MKAIILVVVLLAIVLFLDARFLGALAKERAAGYVQGQEDLRSMSQIRRSARTFEACHKYGDLHSTPWSFFTIDEKMYLCAYGSSGNKLSNKEIDQIRKKYGSNS